METPHVAIKRSSYELPIAHPGTVMELSLVDLYTTPGKIHSQKIDLEHKNVLSQNKHSVSTTTCWMLC